MDTAQFQQLLGDLDKKLPGQPQPIVLEVQGDIEINVAQSSPRIVVVRKN